jgi:hypothetical protein
MSCARTCGKGALSKATRIKVTCRAGGKIVGYGHLVLYCENPNGMIVAHSNLQRRFHQHQGYRRIGRV